MGTQKKETIGCVDLSHLDDEELREEVSPELLKAAMEVDPEAVERRIEEEKKAKKKGK